MAVDEDEDEDGEVLWKPAVVARMTKELYCYREVMMKVSSKRGGVNILCAEFLKC